MRKITSTTVLLLVIALLSIALASTLWFKVYESNWGVQLAYGLDLEEIGVGTITSIQWGTIARYSTVTKDFNLMNTGTQDVNVTLTMPNNSSRYEFTTNFNDTLIAFEDYYTFRISLTDLDMESDGLYSGNFTFSIV